MILLDTHIVVWLSLEPGRLSRKAVAAIRDARSSSGGLAISGVTLYELTTFLAKGRIRLTTPLEPYLKEVEARFIVRPITGRICLEAQKFPGSYPKDPVDRIIGATAIIEGLALITADAAIRASKAIPTIW